MKRLIIVGLGVLSVACGEVTLLEERGGEGLAAGSGGAGGFDEPGTSPCAGEDGAACDDGNACTVDDVCLDGGCSGVPMECPVAPAPVCIDTKTLESYGVPACHAGMCSNEPELTTCPGACVGDACVDGESWTDVSTFDAPYSAIHTTVWTGSEMIIWGGQNNAAGGGSDDHSDVGARYSLNRDVWTLTSTEGAPEGRKHHTAVWTGTEMIVWGGQLHDQDYSVTATGGRYDPEADAWIPTSTASAPPGRDSHSAVWTGSEMIVWGGRISPPDEAAVTTDTGFRYDPISDTWSALSTAGAPLPRFQSNAVWTGTEMIVWGGRAASSEHLGSGARYHPATDSWFEMSLEGAPTPRSSFVMVWTGTEVIVWGGDSAGTAVDTGARYNPTTDTWTPITTAGAAAPRRSFAGVWTGTELIVWGGYTDTPPNCLGDGGRYDPTNDTWSTTADSGMAARFVPVAVWTGSEMLVWGGACSSIMNTGARYLP